MDHGTDTSWRFRVACPHAERVYLVKESDGNGSTWLPMRPVGSDVWELGMGLPPGRYQFSYFMAEGDTYFNGRSHGLSVTPQGVPDPRVTIEPTADTLMA